MSLKSLDEILEEYPEDEISIISVGDINILEEPYFYKVVLECINENGYSWHPVVEIAPELLHKRYKIGALFKNRKQIGYRKDITISSFEINTDYIPRINKIKDLITPNDIKIINNEKTYNYFLEQNAYLFTYDEYELIVPHYTIANHFHFRSSALKHAILDSGLFSLYHPHTFKITSEEKVYIHVKAKANKSDLKTICNFLYFGEEDNYIKHSFTKYFEQRSQVSNKYGNCQIQAIFPIKGNFNIKGISRQINLKGKPKLLLLGIYQDDYKYPFKEIDYLVDSYSLSRKTSIPPSTFKRENPTLNTGRIVNKPPHAKYLINNKFFIENEFDEINEIKLNPTLLGLETNSRLLIQKVEKKVDGSFEPPKKDGDENIQGERSTTEDVESKNKEKFDFEKFEILFKSLNNDIDINNANINDAIEMSPKKNKSNYIVSRYFIFEKIPRSYMYGSFSYLNIKIIFAEIEHGNGWENISTWFFILINNKSKETELINNVIHKYIAEKKILKDIDNLLLAKGILFYRKTHPDSDLNTENIKRWVSDLKNAIKVKLKIK